MCLYLYEGMPPVQGVLVVRRRHRIPSRWSLQGNSELLPWAVLLWVPGAAQPLKPLSHLSSPQVFVLISRLKVLYEGLCLVLLCYAWLASLGGLLFSEWKWRSSGSGTEERWQGGGREGRLWPRCTVWEQNKEKEKNPVYIASNSVSSIN